MRRSIGQPARNAWPPFLTASSWDNIYAQLWDIALRRPGGTQTSADGTLAPALTNGEIQMIVRAWQSARRSLWPLWYQFAAAAYNWNPDNGDRLDTSAKWRDAFADVEIVRELWLSTFGLRFDLDATQLPKPRLDLDAETFDDAVWQAEVRAELRADGASASFKIPLPACKDPKTGKATTPKYTCPRGYKLVVINGIPMCKHITSGKLAKPKLECDVVKVDDPITAIGKSLRKDLATVVIVAAVLYLVLGNKPRHRAQGD